MSTYSLTFHPMSLVTWPIVHRWTPEMRYSHPETHVSNISAIEKKTLKTGPGCLYKICIHYHFPFNFLIIVLVINKQLTKISQVKACDGNCGGKYIDGLVQERCNSSALAMESCLSCPNPLICSIKVTIFLLPPSSYIWIFKIWEKHRTLKTDIYWFIEALVILYDIKAQQMASRLLRAMSLS